MFALLRRYAAILCTLALFPAICAAQWGPPRPKITGISHVGYYVSDLPAALTFWHGLLGFDVYWELKKPGSDETRIAFLKINDHQHVELFNEPTPHPPNMLSHICFTTDSIVNMRGYLASSGISVPKEIGTTKAGDLAFEIKDPDGMLVEFVEPRKDGQEARAAGKFAPPSRISTQIYHTGFLVGNTERSLDFYGRVLGFKETWRGSPNPNELSWINMKVPDGDDYVEFMLYSKAPTTSKDFGGKNHLALAVPDIAAAAKELATRPAYKVYGKPLTIATGINGKRQLNLYDPDGTRVELMETHTADGRVVPSSTAPPPAPSHP